jgi:azurin
MSDMRNVFLTTVVIAATSVFVPGPAEAAPKVCKLEIAGTDLMQYDKKELKVAADCAEVELTLKHTGKLPLQTMGHNWVLVRAPDANAVSSAGLAAGLKNNHVPAGDKRVLAATKMIGGGQTTSVRFSTKGLKKGDAYTYICTFPGHSTLMKGKFVFG